MVAGDLVNTASRIQSAAEPGTVLVGDATRRATEAAIAYEDAGEHELKGKAEPVQLWRALRVVAGAGGVAALGRARGRRSSAATASCASSRTSSTPRADERQGAARLVSASPASASPGSPGSSTSTSTASPDVSAGTAAAASPTARASPTGRSPRWCGCARDPGGRGAGVRAGEAPRHASRSTSPTGRARLGRAAPRPPARARGGRAGDEEDLFAAWRLLFERLAEESPTVLVFEDMQWADAALLDFVEYLLEWSRNQPLFVFRSPARSSPSAARTGASGKRNFTSLYLEPLPRRRWTSCSTGSSRACPEELRERDPRAGRGRAAVRGRDGADAARPGPARPGGRVYRPTGPIESLEVPETLHASSPRGSTGSPPTSAGSSRTPRARQDVHASQGAHARSPAGRRPSSSRCSPRSSARRCCRSRPIRARPSAASTASSRTSSAVSPTRPCRRQERKAQHLAAAHPRRRADEEEVVEVVASHYLEALRGGARGAGRRRRSGRRRGAARPRRRAGGVARGRRGGAALLRAGAELTDDPLVRAELHERAGRDGQGRRRARTTPQAHFERAIALFERAGGTHRPRASRRGSRTSCGTWANRGGLERMEQSFEVLAQDEPDATWPRSRTARRASLLRWRGRARMERIESALEHRGLTPPLPETISQALNTKGLILSSIGFSGTKRRLASSASLSSYCRGARQAVNRIARASSYLWISLVSQFDRIPRGCRRPFGTGLAQEPTCW